MKQVRALKMGYYNNARVREGQVFHLKDDKQYSKEWMEIIDESQPRPSHQVKYQGRKQTHIVDNSDDVI